MIKDSLKEKLSGFNMPVYYGALPAKKSPEVYNYIVFAKDATEIRKPSASDRFEIVVTMENYIDDKVLDDIIETVTSIPGMKIPDGSQIEYAYGRKASTSTVIEQARFIVSKLRKMC